MDRLIVRFADGRVLKGRSQDFSPLRDQFHIRRLGRSEQFAVSVEDLKAVFYVKYFDGKPFRKAPKGFPATTARPGRKVIVKFSDGEELYGVTQSYSPGQRGFFVYPADMESNNERVFVVNGPAVADVAFPE